MYDYKNQLKNDFNSVRRKRMNLENAIKCFEGGYLDGEPDCPLELLKEQLETMVKYEQILKLRVEYSERS